VYVNQDGVQWNAPVVFDTSSRRRDAVTIGVFVMHGKVPPPNDSALRVSIARSKYDGLGPDYARFLLDELLPR